MSARMIASVTPARAIPTISSIVTAEAVAGSRSPATNATARIVFLEIARMMRGAATRSPPREAGIIGVFYMSRRGRLLSAQDSRSFGWDSRPTAAILVSCTFPGTYAGWRTARAGTPLASGRVESKEFTTMLSNRLAFAALAVACIGAAAGGGYLASRQNVVPAPASAEVAPAPVPAPALTATAEQPASAPAVQE